MSSTARVMMMALATALGVAGCRDPVAPMVPSCSDEYRPAMCLDGDEICETDDRGCRVCTCNRDEGPGPEGP